MDESSLLFYRERLLEIEIEMEAMKAENSIREYQGKSPAYDEAAFMGLQVRARTLADRF